MIDVVQGHGPHPYGQRHGGSRSIPVGAVSAYRASEGLADNLKKLAADKLEAAVADLALAGGRVVVAGTDKGCPSPRSPPCRARRLTCWRRRTSSSAGRDLPQRHPCGRGGDRPGDGADRDRQLRDRRRFRADREPAAARRPGAWRHRAGHRPSAARAHCLHKDGQLLSASFMDYCMPRGGTTCRRSASQPATCPPRPTRSASRALAKRAPSAPARR